MKPASTAQIRQRYLTFFEQRGHVIIPSASLLPENDPTTLFTGSGMQPMLPYLLGEAHPLGKRIVDSQKCFRSVDIEEVGDNRHTTFFEMLGNWSLGDYFKEDQIMWMFQFLVNLGLNPQRIYVTVFRGNSAVPRDEESVMHWKKAFKDVGIEAKDIDFPERDGIQNGRIFYYDEKKNWWSRAGEPAKMPVGEPGGPDSEMFWDFGAERRLHEQSKWSREPCHVNCDCGRFLEIGNNVFMEYRKTAKGFERLAQQNVDFGGGLERMAAAVNDDPDVFMIDLFAGMRRTLEELSQRTYGSDPEHTKALRIVMDHLRGATFLIGDGAVPSNRDQGYFTRRLVRRAIRFGNLAGIERNFCSRVAREVIETYKDLHLMMHQSFIEQTLDAEEAQFRKTLARGERELQEYLSTASEINGAKVFYFYETYGFPRELTEEIVQRQGKELTQPELFESSKQSHQDLSRTAAAGKFSGGLADHSGETTKLHTATHLLNAALRTVLGDHVFQKGSNVTAERLRFDFSHPQKMTPEEVQKVEELVNDAIRRDLPVGYSLMSVEEAKKKGAIGVFDAKYGDSVKVYGMGDFSLEICGGPHVSHTGALGSFKIQKEEAVAAGIRRIKAVLSGGPKDVEVAGEAR